MNPVLVMEKGKGCRILDVRIGLWSQFIPESYLKLI
jgi:hypothetical protein